MIHVLQFKVLAVGVVIGLDTALSLHVLNPLDGTAQTQRTHHPQQLEQSQASHCSQDIDEVLREQLCQAVHTPICVESSLAGDLLQSNVDVVDTVHTLRNPGNI